MTASSSAASLRPPSQLPLPTGVQTRRSSSISLTTSPVPSAPAAATHVAIRAMQSPSLAPTPNFLSLSPSPYNDPHNRSVDLSSPIPVVSLSYTPISLSPTPMSLSSEHSGYTWNPMVPLPKPTPIVATSHRQPSPISVSEMVNLIAEIARNFRIFELKEWFSLDWFKNREQLWCFVAETLDLESPSLLAIYSLIALDLLTEGDLGIVKTKVVLTDTIQRCFAQLQPEHKDAQVVEENRKIIDTLKEVLGPIEENQGLRSIFVQRRKELDESIEKFWRAIGGVRNLCDRASEILRIDNLSIHVDEHLRDLCAQKTTITVDCCAPNVLAMNFWSLSQRINFGAIPSAAPVQLQMVSQSNPQDQAMPVDNMIGLVAEIARNFRTSELKERLSSDWFKNKEQLQEFVAGNLRLKFPNIFIIYSLRALGLFTESDLAAVEAKVLAHRSTVSATTQLYLTQLKTEPKDSDGVKESEEIVTILREIFSSIGRNQGSIVSKIQIKIENLGKLSETFGQKCAELDGPSKIFTQRSVGSDRLREIFTKGRTDLSTLVREILNAIWEIQSLCKSDLEKQQIGRILTHLDNHLRDLCAQEKKQATFYSDLILYWNQLGKFCSDSHTIDFDMS